MMYDHSMLLTQIPQMVPLVKKGCDTLGQKFGEAAESQQSVDVHK